MTDSQVDASSRNTESPGGSHSGSAVDAMEVDSVRVEVTALQQQLAEQKISAKKLNETITLQRHQIDEQLTEITALKQVHGVKFPMFVLERTYSKGHM